MRGRLVAALTVLVALVLPAGAGAASPFEWRGIVEGPYGRPWDAGQRERVIRWMPAHGFNAYVHAPKDDLYQRTHWRDAYPAEEQASFAREIVLARSLGVQWIPNLSPALPLIPTPALPDRAPSRDLCFSCPADLDAVKAKLQPFLDAGADTVMISFDDVTKTLSHAEDLAAYGPGDEGFGKANGDFLTRLARALPRKRVLTVGADYSGTADTPYLTGLRATLDPAVEVMWTGTGIPSAHWTADEARAYGERIGRKPLVWDNWTNNDTAGNATPAGSARIFLGPYRRAAGVAASVGGFFFNPMNEADLNLLPLATAGDWMADPVRYRAEESWLRAVRGLAGRARDSLRAWAETSWSNKLDPDEAPTFVRRNDVFLRRYRAGGEWGGPLRSLLAELRLARDASKPLAGLGAFTEQAKLWLDAARVAAGAGHLGTRLLAAERPAIGLRRVRGPRGRTRLFRGSVHPPDPARADALRDQYGAGKEEFERGVRFVYGWRGGTAFEVPPYAVPRNVMDVYFDAVDELDAAWDGERASRSVRLELDGRRLKLGAGGRFRLGRRACGLRLEATDSAGGETVRRLPRCR